MILYRAHVYHVLSSLFRLNRFSLSAKLGVAYMSWSKASWVVMKNILCNTPMIATTSQFVWHLFCVYRYWPWSSRNISHRTLVLVLIKDLLRIISSSCSCSCWRWSQPSNGCSPKRHPCTRDLFLHQSLKNWHRKTHAVFASSLTFTHAWSEPV